MLGRKPDDAERRQRIRELIEQQIGMLDRYEVVDGGWAYYDFNAQTKKPSGSTISFVTAAVLVALHEAQAGRRRTCRKRLIDRAMASIRRQRKPDFSYDLRRVSEVAADDADQPARRQPGPLAGLQPGHAALGRQAGDRRRAEDVARSAVRAEPVARHRPEAAHPARVVVPGGRLLLLFRPLLRRAVHRAASREGSRPPFQDQLAHVLLRLQEKDGSWWDFPMYDYHQQYGTAFALMSLHRTRKTTLKRSTGR